MKLTDLNKLRTEEYRKDEASENFMENMNTELTSLEQSLYTNEEHPAPFVFIYGVPRSGTTIITQLLIHKFDLGYINNLAARFWKAPVVGLKFADAVLDNNKRTELNSQYGKTTNLKDIHEFGYFWRDWLKIKGKEGIANASEVRKKIDWAGLKLSLDNIRNHFQKSVLFKNLYGAFHEDKMDEVLNRSIHIHISRPHLDNAISIWDAREKFYKDHSIWWSTMPKEIDELEGLPAELQVAGQIHYLEQYYKNVSEKIRQRSNNVISISLPELLDEPDSFFDSFLKMHNSLGYPLPGVLHETKKELNYRSYENRIKEREMFRKAFEHFSS